MTGLSRVALRLEPLHDRTLPSVSVVQTGSTLTINGDQHANAVQIMDDGTPTGLTVAVDGTNYPRTGAVDKVVVQARAGNDTVSYTLTGDYTATNRTVDVFLGNGNDTFTADLGHAIDAASTLALHVDGGNGKDDLTVTGSGGGAIAGGLMVELLGGNGIDGLSFDDAADVTGSLKVLVDGGNAKDMISANYTGAVDGQLDLTATGGNGMDAVDGSVSVTGGAGSVTTHVLGGNGKDDLGLSVTGDGLAGLSALDASIDIGHGKDTVTATDNVIVLGAVHGHK
jgi:hypothetical protein